MKIHFSLVACDLNENYIDYYSLIQKYWKSVVNVDTKLILISEYLPLSLNDYKDSIILFKPISNIPTAFQAQCIRILYPCLFKNNSNIILSDMDLITLSSDYFNKTIEKFQDDCFIVYRDVISEHKQYPICFCLAARNVWRTVFPMINTEEDIRRVLTEWYSSISDYRISCPYSKGWAYDQIQLFDNVNKMIERKVIKLGDTETKFKRLDRMDNLEMNYDDYKQKIVENVYSDFHLPRPYKKYKDLLYKLGIY